MKLFHGTYEEKLLDIIKDGYLDNTKYSEDTKYVDDMIEKYCGKKLVNNAIYLGNDLISIRGCFDYEFQIDVDTDLNKELLFVANYEYRDEILAYGDNCEEGVEAIKNYINSFVPYKDYKNNYYNAEYLYFDKINIEKFKEEVEEFLKESIEC